MSADVVLLTALRINPEFEQGGLGGVLVRNIARTPPGAGLKAVETFGDLQESAGGCIIPAGFLRQVGSKTVRRHPRWPRLRLELRTAISWEEDVEAVLDRLLGTASVKTAEPALGQGRSAPEDRSGPDTADHGQVRRLTHLRRGRPRSAGDRRR